MLAHLAIAMSFLAATSEETPVVIRNAAGWPVVFELKCGEDFDVTRSVNDTVIRKQLRLISVKESWEPDLWVSGNAQRQTLRDAEVTIEVDGVRATLHARPYQFPTIVNGLRIYAEATRNWATHDEVAPLTWHGGDVRFSAVAEGETWGPETLRFPIQNFRWRASSYNNSWLSLVPYNKLYYHRGEDFGAIPDRLPVVAMLDGTVVTSPLPRGDGQSNSLAVDCSGDLKYRFAHMNVETIVPRLTVGARVKAGDVVGKTGMTWNGHKSQTHDHHLHTQLDYADTNISTYPFLVEAYLRDYSDPVLAVAGGYAFGLPGNVIHLDGSRSIARPGQTISDYTWQLHDGRRVSGRDADVRYDQPGLYSETLIVRTEQGGEDHDYLQVRIYNPEHPRQIAFGWFYHWPVRGIVPGSEVTFENRMAGTAGDVYIDFGDASHPLAIAETTRHAYQKPGIYDASLSCTSRSGETSIVRMRVVVDN